MQSLIIAALAFTTAALPAPDLWESSEPPNVVALKRSPKIIEERNAQQPKYERPPVNSGITPSLATPTLPYANDYNNAGQLTSTVYIPVFITLDPAGNPTTLPSWDQPLVTNPAPNPWEQPKAPNPWEQPKATNPWEQATTTNPWEQAIPTKPSEPLPNIPNMQPRPTQPRFTWPHANRPSTPSSNSPELTWNHELGILQPKGQATQTPQPAPAPPPTSPLATTGIMNHDHGAPAAVVPTPMVTPLPTPPVADPIPQFLVAGLIAPVNTPIMVTVTRGGLGAPPKPPLNLGTLVPQPPKPQNVDGFDDEDWK